MAMNRYKLALNNARFPMVSTWGERAVVIPSMDIAVRANRGFQGSEDSIDYDVPQILYGENFVPVTNGIKSVSYLKIIEPAVPPSGSFDQIFPLRDNDERAILCSPAKGINFIYDPSSGLWGQNTINSILTAATPSSMWDGSLPTTARVTRAYVDGKTYICYARQTGHTSPGGVLVDASIYEWIPGISTGIFTPAQPPFALSTISNLPIPIGEIDGIASSNGYLVIWSGLTVYWAPFDGTNFDFSVYANGEVTGAGSQIPEDLQGLITAIIPVSGGMIIFTTKNAVAAFYNPNNFASPWIFKLIGNAGGLESYEQATVEGNLATIYAYTTGGMQKISLNQAEGDFPDVTDFLGGRYLESFNPESIEFEPAAASGGECFVKVTYAGQRFVIISYGFVPGIFSYALVYDVSLKRWGKLRLEHRDAFFYSYGSQQEDLTYNMMIDVSYDDTDPDSYDSMIIESGNLVYPRQSIAFLLATGEVKLAILDYRTKDDDSSAFVLLGKNQLSRSRLATVHEVEIEGLRAGGKCAILRSVNGANSQPADLGFLREQEQNYSEYGFDCVTAKNHTLFVEGDFFLTTIIFHATNDGSF